MPLCCVLAVLYLLPYSVSILPLPPSYPEKSPAFQSFCVSDRVNMEKRELASAFASVNPSPQLTERASLVGILKHVFIIVSCALVAIQLSFSAVHEVKQRIWPSPALIGYEADAAEAFDWAKASQPHAHPERDIAFFD